jgi:hypothetical protein
MRRFLPSLRRPRLRQMPPISGGSPLLAGPFQGEWDATVGYVVGNFALRNGGIWKCAAPNTNSEPISGNANWTLVGGTPYIDVEVLDAQIRTASSLPITLLAPAGERVLLFPMGGGPGLMELRTVDAFSASVTFKIVMRGGSDDEDAISIAEFSGGAMEVPNNLLVGVMKPTSAGYDTALIDTTQPLSMANCSIVLKSNADVTGGDGSTLRLRVPYLPLVLSQGLYAITAVDQMAKTFTVQDPSAALSGATGTFEVVGSTGNNATYTIASAVAGAGSTVITVVESIPDATADGWVKR